MPKKLEKSENYAIAFNRLIDVCNANNVSISSLLDKFATSRSAITAWKKGNISTDVLASIANELDVSLDYLLTGKEKSSPTETLTADEQELLTYYNKLDAFQKGQLLERAIVLSESAKTPLEQRKNTIFIEYYSLPASAGTGVYLDNCDKEMIEVEESSETSEANFALKVSGNSMEPRFHDGDLVLIKSQPSVELGDIGIFIINDEGFIKKFGGDKLISLNPEYDDINLHEYDDIYCRGKVIGVI
nr:MAG TPA: Repressor protein CI [Caudoviricetes sp.]